MAIASHSKHGKNCVLEEHVMLYNMEHVYVIAYICMILTTLLGITHCASTFEWHKRTAFVLWTMSVEHYYPLISALNFLLITFMSVILCNPYQLLIRDKILLSHRRKPRRNFNCTYFFTVLTNRKGRQSKYLYCSGPLVYKKHTKVLFVCSFVSTLISKSPQTFSATP